MSSDYDKYRDTRHAKEVGITSTLLGDSPPGAVIKITVVTNGEFELGRVIRHIVTTDTVGVTYTSEVLMDNRGLTSFSSRRMAYLV